MSLSSGIDLVTLLCIFSALFMTFFRYGVNVIFHVRISSEEADIEVNDVL